MIVDVHTHIFPPEVRNSREKFVAEDSAFALLYRSEKARMVGARALVAEMDGQGVEASVAFGFPWKDLERAAWHNDYVLEASKRFEGRIIPLACFDPRSQGSFREAQRCIAQGHKGLGELALYEGLDDAGAAILSPFLQLCREAGVCALIHANEPVGHSYHGKADMDLGALYRLIRDNPGTKVILAHMGGGLFFYETLKKEVRETLAEVYYDTAAVPFLYRKYVYRLAVRIAGAERIVFGSDYPLIEVSRYTKDLEGAGLTTEEIELIIGENARRLFLG
jgi:predicted TIM-barrel fold metal-dependent hydrolase